VEASGCVHFSLSENLREKVKFLDTAVSKNGEKRFKVFLKVSTIPLVSVSITISRLTLQISISYVISSSHSLSAVARKVNKSVNIYSRNDLSQVFRPLSYKISSLNVKGLNVLMTLLAAYIPIVVTDRVGVVPTDKNHCFGSFSVSKAKKSKLQKEYNEVNEFNESENIKQQVNKYPKLLNISDLSTVSSWRTNEILTDYTKELNELRPTRLSQSTMSPTLT